MEPAEKSDAKSTPRKPRMSTGGKKKTSLAPKASPDDGIVDLTTTDDDSSDNEEKKKFCEEHEESLNLGLNNPSPDRQHGNIVKKETPENSAAPKNQNHAKSVSKSSKKRKNSANSREDLNPVFNHKTVSDKSKRLTIAIGGCVLCGRKEEDNGEIVGKLFRDETNKVAAHELCMYFACQLVQREGPLNGFDFRGIKSEFCRGSKWTCYVCGKKGATVGCCEDQCKKVFHLFCGRKAGEINEKLAGEGATIHEFRRTHRSWCPQHRPCAPMYSYVKKRKDPGRYRICFPSLVECEICRTDKVLTIAKAGEVVRTVCCKGTKGFFNRFYHHSCIQTYALKLGAYTKCPHCADGARTIKHANNNSGNESVQLIEESEDEEATDDEVDEVVVRPVGFREQLRRSYIYVPFREAEHEVDGTVQPENDPKMCVLGKEEMKRVNGQWTKVPGRCLNSDPGYFEEAGKHEFLDWEKLTCPSCDAVTHRKCAGKPWSEDEKNFENEDYKEPFWFCEGCDAVKEGHIFDRSASLDSSVFDASGMEEDGGDTKDDDCDEKPVGSGGIFERVNSVQMIGVAEQDRNNAGKSCSTPPTNVRRSPRKRGREDTPPEQKSMEGSLSDDYNVLTTALAVRNADFAAKNYGEEELRRSPRCSLAVERSHVRNRSPLAVAGRENGARSASVDKSDSVECLDDILFEENLCKAPEIDKMVGKECSSLSTKKVFGNASKQTEQKGLFTPGSEGKLKGQNEFERTVAATSRTFSKRYSSRRSPPPEDSRMVSPMKRLGDSTKEKPSEGNLPSCSKSAVTGGSPSRSPVKKRRARKEEVMKGQKKIEDFFYVIDISDSPPPNQADQSITADIPPIATSSPGR